MTRLTLSLLTPLLLAGAVAAAPVENPDQATAAARSTLSDTVDEVLGVLRDADGTDAKLVRLEAITDRRFDFPRMTKLVLGRNRKKLSEEQQVEFQHEFKRHLTITYGNRIEGFAGEQIEIGEARLERNGDVTVKTKLVGGAADGLLVDYRMRESEGSWGIIDGRHRGREPGAELSRADPGHRELEGRRPAHRRAPHKEPGQRERSRLRLRGSRLLEQRPEPTAPPAP